MLCATIPKDPTTVLVDQGILEMDKRAKIKTFAPFRSIQIKINSRWFKSVERSSTQKNIPFNRRRVAFCKNHFQLLTVKTSLRSFINIFVHTIINEPVVPLKKSFGVSYCKFVIFLLSHYIQPICSVRITFNNTLMISVLWDTDGYFSNQRNLKMPIKTMET